VASITFRAVDAQSPSEELEWRGNTDAGGATGLAVTLVGLDVFPLPPLLEPLSIGGVNDTHFHPCSFSHHCVPASRIVEEMDLAGVRDVALFGLQHTLVAGASPWKSSADGLDDVPFHYGNQGASPSGDQFTEAKNERTERTYDAWPVSPTIYADVHTALDLAAVKVDARERLHYYASGLRIESAQPASGMPPLEWNSCSRRGDFDANLTYIRALDTLFPGLVEGFAEYNLNKVVLFRHGATAPDASSQELACWKPFMDYLASTQRPIGFHADLAPDQSGRSGFEKLLSVSKAFPQNEIVWLHGGSAPEASKGFHAEHIKRMEEFLASAPGKRFVELSWPRGFFLALERACDDVASCARDLASYASFFEKNREALLFGSDQVSLFYPSYLGKATGEAFVNQLGYLYGLTYPSTIRVQLGYLDKVWKASVRPIAEDVLAKMVRTNFVGQFKRDRAGRARHLPLEKSLASRILIEAFDSNVRELSQVAASRRAARGLAATDAYQDPRYIELRARLVAFLEH
jgi:hypothetical protein